MSKVKAPKTKGVPNKHLHARTNFLYQAATYLTLQTSAMSMIGAEQTRPGTRLDELQTQSHSPVALQLGSDLQQVSRKAQLRLSIDLKRSMCKSCNSILVPGQTATQAIENLSKGGRKPWADVLILACNFCGSKKKFPIGASKQLKKSKRGPALTETTSCTPPEDAQQSESTLLTDGDQTSRTG